VCGAGCVQGGAPCSQPSDCCNGQCTSGFCGTGVCEHNECVDGTPLSPACNPCSATVCAVDPYCCDVGWDSQCVTAARYWCGFNEADLNTDGRVDAADLAQLLGAWGMPGATDLNHDGTTNAADIGILLARWG
jgi:hypothetical protein